MRILAVVAALLLTCAISHARTVRAVIYFRGWHAESFAAVTPEGLRDMARSFPSIQRTVSGEGLQSLLGVLDLQHMQPKRGLCSQNTNLVVDLFESSGARHSYRADGLYLCSIDNSSSRPIDKAFLKYFEDLFPPKGLTNRWSRPLAGVMFSL